MANLSPGTYSFSVMPEEYPDDAGYDDVFDAIADMLTRAGLATTYRDNPDSELYDPSSHTLVMTDTQIMRLERILSDPTGLNPRGAGRKPVYLRVIDKDIAEMPAWEYFSSRGVSAHIRTVTVTADGTERKTSTRTYQKRIAALKTRYVENDPQHNMLDRVLKLPLEQALNAIK